MTLNGKNVARERRVGLNVILPLLFTDFSLSLRFRLAPSAFRFSRRRRLRRRRRRGRRRKGKYAPRLRSSVIFQPSVWLASSLLLCLRPPSFFLLFATSDRSSSLYAYRFSTIRPPPFSSLPTYTCNTVASLKKFFLLSSSSLIKLLRAFKRLSN